MDQNTVSFYPAAGFEVCKFQDKQDGLEALSKT